MRSSTELKNYQHEQHDFKFRLAVLGLLVLIAFGVLTTRFYFLQISRYDYYQTLAENNRISIFFYGCDSTSPPTRSARS